MGPGQAGKDGTGGASQAPSPVLPVPRISGSGLPQMVVVPNSQGPSLQVVWNPLNAAQGAERSQSVSATPASQAPAMYNADYASSARRRLLTSPAAPPPPPFTPSSAGVPAATTPSSLPPLPTSTRAQASSVSSTPASHFPPVQAYHPTPAPQSLPPATSVSQNPVFGVFRPPPLQTHYEESEYPQDADAEHYRLVQAAHMGPHGDSNEYDPLVESDGEGQESDLESEEEDKPLVNKRRPPIEHKWNLWPCFLFLWFMGAMGYYFYVRITELNGSYGLFVLIIEFLGVTSFLPYAILITRGYYPTPSPGLPAAGTQEAMLMSPPAKTPAAPRFPAHLAAYADPTGHIGTAPDIYNPVPLVTPNANLYTPRGLKTPATGFKSGLTFPGYGPQSGPQDEEAYRFHVRVMIPCYKEPLEVVAATVQAARGASLPAYTRRTVYLCDDGKDPVKRQFVDSLGPDVVYVTGRKRKPGEINGKSSNLNNCLKNVIYASWPKNDDDEIDWSEISNKELIVVFDADMCAKQEFYLRILEVMMDDDTALCLTPQSFHNISQHTDLFNNINKQFWECWLPGAFAWGYIACTGTNFCIRARALAHCGWFPDYTITEDYALGMELKTRGYHASYLMLYLAEGEAPEEIRNVFRQRSRWTKGHYQVFFSMRSPLLNMRLPFFQRLWYSYAAWAPMATCVIVPTFIIVPFMSIVAGYNPVTITFRFVLAATLYYTPQALISNHVHTWGDWKLIWFANNSNVVLWFTYLKALINVTLSKLGMKTVAFKVTEKVKTADPNAALAAAQVAQAADAVQRKQSVIGRMVSTVLNTVRKKPPPREDALLSSAPESPKTTSNPPVPGTVTKNPLVAATPGKGLSRLAAATPGAGSHKPNSVRFETPSKGGGATIPLTPRRDSLKTRDQLRVQTDPLTAGAPLGSSAYVRGATPLPATEVGAKGGWERFKSVFKSFKPANIREFDEMFDPVALFILWAFSTGTFAFGIWQLPNNVGSRAPAAFEFDSPMRGSPYLIISTMWAGFNCIAPYLFLHYCFTAGKSFKWMCKILMFFSHFVLLCSIAIIWLLIPTDFNVREPLALQISNYLPAQIAQDSNSNFEFVIGKDAYVVQPEFDPAYLIQIQTALAEPGTPGYGKRRMARELLARTLAGDIDTSAHPDGWDPVGLTDEDLKSNDPLTTWHRQLLQSADVANVAANLTGGLLVRDHVKYNMPMAYSITNLAWALETFPEGYTALQKVEVLRVIRAGAEYLMRCLLRLKNGEYVYVAQVGDGRHYVPVTDPATSVEQSDLIWTAPQLDPYLNGQRFRKVWLLTGLNVGSDLLANAAAALAATSQVYRPVSPSFATLAFTVAQRLYTFAGLTPPGQRPHSYCEYVPCTTNITVNKNVNVLKDTVYEKQINPYEAQCYYIDWLTFTCRVGWTAEDCEAALKVRSDVFKSKIACCSVLTATGVWNQLTTRAQGICAVPDNTYSCYIPNTGERTCYEGAIDPRTGAGCSGKGLEVFASPSACCNFLTTKGSIDPSAGKAGVGICASINFQNSTQQCYVPSLAKATCEINVGTNCTIFGLETVFTDPTSCCNRLLVWFQQMGYNTPTGIQVAPKGICQYSYDNSSGPIVRKLQSHSLGPAVSEGNTPASGPPAGSKRRKLAVTPGDYWKPPPSAASEGCTDDNCYVKVIQVNETVSFYNSTSTLDDMAWAGIWLYRASNDTRYLGESQRYIARHYKEDITPQVLNANRSYYEADWNNVAWAVNVLLYQHTENKLYEERVLTFLNTWVFGTSVEPQKGMLAPQSKVNMTEINALIPYNDTATNTTLFIVPTCNATFPVETYCFDGIDNDCDGLIDREDVDCGLFPVNYSPKELAYSSDPSLPKAAMASWLGIVYGELTTTNRQRRLRCWALGQAGYMLGATPDTRSYVAGYGDAPTIVQHRASSCPATPEGGLLPCDWDNAYWPAVSNPQMKLVAGALMNGPDMKDKFTEQRSNQDTAVSVDGTVPFTGLLAALTATDTRLRSCELMFGVIQRITSTQEL